MECIYGFEVQNVHGNIINPFAAYIILQTSQGLGLSCVWQSGATMGECHWIVCLVILESQKTAQCQGIKLRSVDCSQGVFSMPFRMQSGNSLNLKDASKLCLSGKTMHLRMRTDRCIVCRCYTLESQMATGNL